MTPSVTLSVRASVPMGAMREDAPTHTYNHPETVEVSRDTTAMVRATSSERNEGCCSKRSCGRGADGGAKKTFCDASAEPTLISSVAALLQRIAAQNKSEGCGAPCFLSATEPAISVPDYLERLARFFQCSRECFVLALIYIDRLLKGNSHIWLCPLNVHRLVVTALMVAVKFADDAFYSNAYYAKVGGLPLREINHLEATLLRMIHFRLHVLPWEFHKFLRLIVEFPFSSSSRPSALCPNSTGRNVPTPAADNNSTTADCKTSKSLHCGNPSCSPSGSTAYFSGSSQSVSPPFSPEAPSQVKSPSADDVDPGLQQHRCGNYGDAVRSFQRQQEGGHRGSNCCYGQEQLKRAAGGPYHPHMQVEQQVQQGEPSRSCAWARAAGGTMRHFDSATVDALRGHQCCSVARHHSSCFSTRPILQEEATFSQ